MGWAELQAWGMMAGHSSIWLTVALLYLSHVPRLCALCEDGGVKAIHADDSRVPLLIFCTR